MACLKRLAGVFACAVLPYGAYVAYESRPRHSREEEFHERMMGELQDLSVVDKFAKSALQSTLFFGTGLLSHLYLHILNKTDVLGDVEGFKKLVNAGRCGRPLVTISNHQSIYDDPSVLAELVPASTLFELHKMRWGICSEELCFDNPRQATMFGMGRVIPIQRGGSIYQPGMAHLGRRMAHGEWVHVFPEGRVWQEGGSPLRDAEGRNCSKSGRCAAPLSKVGPMKWGVGKMIANSPIPPVVVPVFHMGMDAMIPQDSNNDTLSDIPRTGQYVTIKVGDPISFDDLVRKYHDAAFRRAAARLAKRRSTHVPAAPTRTPKPRTAFDVPTLWTEPPLMVAPPDHHELTEAEQGVEEQHRRDLYEAITSRCWSEMRKVELEVREFRKAKGYAPLDDAQK